MNDFQAFGLPQSLADAIAGMHYTTPTPIQEKVIPLVLKGLDVLASSHTGSGKTGAFAIPLVAKVLSSQTDTVLILTPTRELATQVIDIVRSLTKNQSSVKTALLIGGDSIDKQYRQLKFSPRIVVGTPGRVNDHLKRRTLKLNNNKFVVLDETDRMLDMGFGVQIDAILKHAPQARQTLMFSATISKQIERLSKNYLSNPEFVKSGMDRAVAPNITQESINVTEQNKYETLEKEIGNRQGSILVFVGTKHGAQKIANRLSADGHEALAIHGDLRQRQRDRVMKSFQAQRNRIMVATDIASRGLDVPHIEHVINYDPPQMAEDYVHRIGRTARAGRSGSSLNLVSARDGKKWREIDVLLKGGEPKPFVRSSSSSFQFGKPRGERSAKGRTFKGGDFKRRDRFSENNPPRSSFNRFGKSEASFFRTEGNFSRDGNKNTPPRKRKEWNSSASPQAESFGRSRRPFNKFGDTGNPFGKRKFGNAPKPFNGERASPVEFDKARKTFNKFGDSGAPSSLGRSDSSKRPFGRRPFAKGNKVDTRASFNRTPHPK